MIKIDRFSKMVHAIVTLRGTRAGDPGGGPVTLTGDGSFCKFLRVCLVADA